ncbi:signal peptidase I [Lachnospiraceae bacterium KM106-2]|nr:signal peptidase I [Lachnospiraceae bacterium KM106-2]
MAFRYHTLDNQSGEKKLVKSIIIWAVQIIIVIFLAFLLVHFGVDKTTMLGDSMKETLSNGETIVINKFSYLFMDPKRNDVIVFRQNEGEHDFYNIKRVVGLPGETIQIKKGFVYVNGKKMTESVNVEEMESAGLAKKAIKLDEGEYFVLGDNRNNSEDSRYSTIGNVVRDDIIGKAFYNVDQKKLVSSINTVKQNLLEDKK